MKIALALVLALPLTTSAADTKEGKPAAPPPEVKKTVDAVNGNWTAKMTLTAPGQKPVKFNGVFKCHKIAAGTAVDCTLNATVPGMGKYDETDLIGYDSETKQVHIMTWNNMGEVHDHRGDWKDDKTISLAHKATQGGKPLDETFEMSFPEKNKLTFKFTSTVDGQTTTFEGSATRG